MELRQLSDYQMKKQKRDRAVYYDFVHYNVEGQSRTELIKWLAEKYSVTTQTIHNILKSIKKYGSKEMA